MCEKLIRVVDYEFAESLLGTECLALVISDGDCYDFSIKARTLFFACGGVHFRFSEIRTHS